MNFQRQIVREAEVSNVALGLCSSQTNNWVLQAISASFTPVVPRSTTSFTLSDIESIRAKEDMAFK